MFRLQETRIIKGITQKQLAEASGLSLNSIRNWEQYRTEPRASELERVAKALDAKIGDLFW